MPIPLVMNGSYGDGGRIRLAAGRQKPRTAPLVAIGVFLGAVVLVGLVAFLQGV